MSNAKYKPVVLIILDGWGLSENTKGNPLKEADLPTIQKFNDFYPHLALQASGISVGLPWGEPGNSEVGHMTIGSGKILYQNMPRITMAIQGGEFFENKALLNAIENAKKNDSALHLMGLVGKGAVHSHTDHLYALLELAHEKKLKKVFVHVFTDGRDSLNTSGKDSVKELQERMEKIGTGKVASLIGRFFAMDRNNNWDRIEKAYDLMVNGIGEKIKDPVKYLEESYKKEIFDEYIEPAVVTKNEEPIGKIEDKDSVIFFNFREDRARQITKAFVLPGFMKFKREPFLKNLEFVTMVEYEEDLPVHVAFKPNTITDCLGKVLSEHKMKQMRIAETEKFAHVTYFFNGGREEAFSNEDRAIVPSLTSVKTYDQAPEMSAEEITQKALSALEKNTYDFMVINYANPDMVGHTGNEKASIKAVEFVDKCLSKLVPEVIKRNGCLLITADHGNVEEIRNVHTGETDTEHSVNPVPLWFIAPDNHSEKRKEKETSEPDGILSDIAPTILNILGIEKPNEMTGESLLEMLK
jgi:2,3-bisphosphoglycerate-independent phosphoglycerate mutase